MRLSEEAAAKVANELQPLRNRLETLQLALYTELAPTLKRDLAVEYLMHGVSRRIKTISRCMLNVFTVFPPNRTKLLGDGELSDVQINLHAFVMNTYGIFDNIAWVYMLEQGREESIKGGRNAIGLFDPRTQQYLSARMQAYLNSAELTAWFREYAKNYRDALAHRIPLYVPPSYMLEADEPRWKELDAQIMPAIKAHRFDDVERITAERDGLGKVCAAFRHSYSDKKSRSVYLHPQMLCDALTVADLGETVVADVKANGWGAATP